MKSEEYVRGRLEGLFQLVTILKEVISEEDTKSAIVQHLVDHIYQEIEEILDYLGENVHHDIRERVKVAKKEGDVQQKVATSYDVLSQLIQKKIEEG